MNRRRMGCGQIRSNIDEMHKKMFSDLSRESLKETTKIENYFKDAYEVRITIKIVVK